jgi:hypothetical protein
MTVPQAAVFPSGRIIAGWWKQLAAYQPRAIWVGKLRIEQLEAACQIRGEQALSGLDRILLGNLEADSPWALSQLDQRLGLGAPFLSELIGQLHARGLAEPSSAGYCLSHLGRTALTSGVASALRTEPRSFWYVSVEPSVPPCFIHHVVPEACQAHGSAVSGETARGLLQHWLNEPAEWKKARGFPLEVESLSQGETDSEQSRALVRFFVLHAAVITGADGAGANWSRAFAYQPAGWTLTGAPVFELAAAWEDTQLHGSADLSLESVRDAWQHYRSQRSLTAPALDSCSLEVHGNRVRLVAAREVLEPLRSLRNDIAKGEAWLLVGKGDIRRALQLELG